MQQPTPNLSVLAARLIEAASLARAGDCENAHTHITHAIALLQGRPLARRQSARGGLLAWQARVVTEHIDANFGRRIPIGELAALLHLSQSYFHRAFKLTFGVGPHSYVVRRRIEMAQGFMLTTRAPLTEIALRCGLSDQSHFSRSFRRIVGVSPLAWRRTRREAVDLNHSMSMPMEAP